MQTKIEGLILSKIPYRDKDLICRVLQRNGKKLTLIFYGGQESRKRNVPHVLELGLLIKAELKYKRQTASEGIFNARESAPSWIHHKIRYDLMAYTLACCYLEALDKIAIFDDLHNQVEEEEEFIGLFRVASNGIFYLEQALKENKFEFTAHFFLFFAKLLQALGVAPRLGHCLFCEKQLSTKEPLLFIPSESGFSCSECNPPTSPSFAEQRRRQSFAEMHQLLIQVAQLKYAQYEQLRPVDRDILQSLFFSFCYQFQLDPKKFRTLKFLFPRQQ